MQISTAKIYNDLKHFNKKLGQQGMTMVEILVSLFLVVIIFTIIPLSLTDDSHQKLQESIEKIDRAVRFATNESILRNSIVRLKIDLDKSPIEYTVEYGQGSDFTLPESKDLSRLSISEREEETKRIEKLDSQFRSIDEFADSSEPLDENISVHGLGTDYYQKIQLEGQVSIYFYPSGEKDAAILFFNNEEELATLKIAPFEDKTYVDYYIFNEYDLANLDDTLENKSKELFEKWLKE